MAGAARCMRKYYASLLANVGKYNLMLRRNHSQGLVIASGTEKDKGNVAVETSQQQRSAEMPRGFFDELKKKDDDTARELSLNADRAQRLVSPQTPDSIRRVGQGSPSHTSASLIHNPISTARNDLRLPVADAGFIRMGEGSDIEGRAPFPSVTRFNDDDTATLMSPPAKRAPNHSGGDV